MLYDTKIVIRRIRELLGSNTESSMAKYLEIPQVTLNYCLAGKRKPSLELIYRICDKYNVSADWLLGLSDARTPANEVAPLQVLPKFRQSKQADITDELAAIRQQLARQEMEIAALKELNSQTSQTTAFCG